MWDDRPGVAKMLNDVADSMAATGFQEEAADLFERCGAAPDRPIPVWMNREPVAQYPMGSLVEIDFIGVLRQGLAL